MTHKEKLTWMAEYAMKNKAAVYLEGECGLGRECVGLSVNGEYPDYEWYDDKTYERTDPNGDVWIPEDAYHKHPCVAILGRGEKAESQLYEWLKWFNDNKFIIQELEASNINKISQVELMMGRATVKRMVKQ